MACFDFKTLRACCNPLVTIVFCNEPPVVTTGNIYTDTNGNCWTAEDYNGSTCTTTSYPDPSSGLTLYTGSTCSTCLSDNPLAICPTLDVSNSYDLCVYWQNTGTNILYRVNTLNGTPINTLYWTRIFGDGYTTTGCTGGVTATSQWTGNIVASTGPVSQLATTSSGWDLSEIRATLYNIDFSANTPDQSFLNVSNGSQFVVCGPSFNELVTVYVAQCAISNDSPCPDPTPTPTPTLTQTLTSTPTPTPTLTETPTNTPTETPTNTPTPTPTLTETATNTPTPTPTLTETPTNTPTETPTNTPTETPTNTPTETPTNTPTPTPTLTETPTNTPTETQTNTPTPTPTLTETPTNTPTPTPTLTETPTNTPTETPTETPTLTPTLTETPTNTPTPTQTLTPTTSPLPITVVQFQDCDRGTNIFRFGGSIVPLTLGNVYYISGGTDFVGCATVVSDDNSGPLYDANGVTFTNIISCSDALCPRTPKVAAVLSKCSDGTIFYAIVDEDVSFVGATYVYNGSCYTFIEASGPGGPDLGAPQFSSCASCIPSTTPTPTPTHPTPTPTPTEVICYCPDTVFCLDTTWTGLNGYTGTYVQSNGWYNCCHFYEGGTYNFGVIYYTGQYWCLSDSLGGPCLLSGSQTCSTGCPDLDSAVFTVGACPPPPTPAVDCTVLDFYAYFDCDYTPPPTSVACDVVDFTFSAMTLTPTPTPTLDSCLNLGINFSMSSYTPSTNVTPTPTPSITPTIPISISGNATFEVFQEQFNCVSVKVLVDCSSSVEYYVSDSLIYSGVPVTTGMTIYANINGINRCATYDRDDNKISSDSIVSVIYNTFGAGCTPCLLTPTPTPSQTQTSTPTPTPSITLTQTPTLTPSVTQTSTPTQTQTIGFVPPPTPTMTLTQTFGLTPTLTRTETATPTPTPTITSTPTNTVTATNTSTPTTTPYYVYVYQSCVPQQFIPYLENQVIQTVQVSGIDQTGTTFKDSLGNCWRYLGRFDYNYIPPINVVATTYQGDYFVGRQSTLYDSCNSCINGTPPTGEFIKITAGGTLSGIPDGCGGYQGNQTSYLLEVVNSNGDLIQASSEIVVSIMLNYSDCLSSGAQTNTINVTIPAGQSSKTFEFLSVDYQPCPFDLVCSPVYQSYNSIQQIYPSTVVQF